MPSSTNHREKPTDRGTAIAPEWLHRALDSDLWYSFRTSPVTIIAATVAVVMIVLALAAPWVAPQNPYDIAGVDLIDAFKPPVPFDGSDGRFILGTDDQGRGMFSTILYGMRLSLFVGFASVIFAMTLGVTLGLISGFFGGFVEILIMRLADIQLSFPNILIALLVDGILRTALPHDVHDELTLYVIIFAIGISNWVQYARTVRGSTLVEKSKEYVQAAQVMGVSPVGILVRHILPNVMGPVLVIATLGLAVAIISEATLSFLGVGLPTTQPSLGTLIRIGNDYLFSGEWWITAFPSLALVALALSVNLLGDWLRDALNPKLR